VSVADHKHPPVRAVILHSDDNVATLLSDADTGDLIRLPSGTCLTARERIPIYFKISLTDLPDAEPIIKYGQPIGRASSAIPKGALVHIHNMTSARAQMPCDLDPMIAE